MAIQELQRKAVAEKISLEQLIECCHNHSDMDMCMYSKCSADFEGEEICLVNRPQKIMQYQERMAKRHRVLRFLASHNLKMFQRDTAASRVFPTCPKNVQMFLTVTRMKRAEPKLALNVFGMKYIDKGLCGIFPMKRKVVPEHLGPGSILERGTEAKVTTLFSCKVPIVEQNKRTTI